MRTGCLCRDQSQEAGRKAEDVRHSIIEQACRMQGKAKAPVYIVDVDAKRIAVGIDHGEYGIAVCLLDSSKRRSEEVQTVRRCCYVETRDVRCR